MLSGYRIMWLIVMFDLPTTTKAERRAYRQFRDFLLDEGFCMTQFSIYMRVQAGKERVDALSKRIRRNLPADGRVSLLQITDKQYENIISFIGRAPGPASEKPEQYVLF